MQASPAPGWYDRYDLSEDPVAVQGYSGYAKDNKSLLFLVVLWVISI
jgi:hypothetical protein